MAMGPGHTVRIVSQVGLHCRIAGRPGRARALARFLDYVNNKPGAWVCRRVDIARHWQENHPPPATAKL